MEMARRNCSGRCPNATIPGSTKYADSSNAEDGLLGLAADPNFATNGWLYLYYSPVRFVNCINTQTRDLVRREIEFQP